MKNAHRISNTPSLFYINCKLKDLIAHLTTELDYAVACYEDGTLSPRRSLQHIKKELEDLDKFTDDLIGYRYKIGEESQSNTLPIQPPATPESL
jgi:hypothetical protein